MAPSETLTSQWMKSKKTKSPILTVLIDDPRELFASGRKRQKRLPDLKIGDMVVVVSECGVLWFGKLKDCKI